MADNHIIAEYYKRLISRNFKPQEVFDVLGVSPNEPFFIKYNNSFSEEYSYLTWTEKYKIDENLNLYKSELYHCGNEEDIYGYEPWIKIKNTEATGFEKLFYYDFSKIKQQMLKGSVTIISSKNIKPIKFGILLKDGNCFRGWFKNKKLLKPKQYDKTKNYFYHPIDYLEKNFILILPEGWKIHECFEIDPNSVLNIDDIDLRKKWINRRFNRWKHIENYF